MAPRGLARSVSIPVPSPRVHWAWLSSPLDSGSIPLQPRAEMPGRDGKWRRKDSELIPDPGFALTVLLVL